MIHLALNVYLWSDEDQTRMLVEALGPAVRELMGEGLARRFWFHRFDARGPHVFAVVTVPDERSAAVVRGRLGTRVEDWLRALPPTNSPSLEEVEKRHLECRGTRLCAPDAEPGIAPDRSYAFAGQDGNGHPFHLSAGMRDREGLWDLLSEVSLWSVDQLRAGAGRASAVRWVASVDRAFAGRREGEALWRFYATTLLYPLRARLETEEAEVLASLPGVVGERNVAAFSRFWDAAEPGGVVPHAASLVERVLADPEISDAGKLALLRELNHTTMAQLGQFVRLRIPLVLYAWLRNLPSPEPARAR